METDRLTIRHRIGCTFAVLVLLPVLRHLRRCRWCAELYARTAGFQDREHRWADFEKRVLAEIARDIEEETRVPMVGAARPAGTRLTNNEVDVLV